MQPRWLIGIGLLIGFLWIRSRTRVLRENPDGGKKALYGVFFFMAPLLFAGKWAFGYLPFGPWQNTGIELVVLGGLFALTGVLFLRKKAE